MGDKKYRDKSWLREQYVENRRSSVDIAEECGVSSNTIRNWLDKHDITTRNRSQAQIDEVKKYHDKEWLREQYVENSRSMRDIADECGITASGVKKWINNYDIDARDSHEHLKKGPASFYTAPEKGYEFVASKHNYKTDSAMVHQLVAIADGANPSKVFSNGRYHIHHKNGVHWDNRPDNLELRSSKTHVFEHHHDDKHKTPQEYANESDKEELLFALRKMVLDWRESDNSTMEMCADELDGKLREL